MSSPLNYEPINFNGLPKAVFFLRDIDGGIMVDAKSLIEAAGMSWRTWAMVIKVRRRLYCAERCLDRNGKETELIPAARVNQLLGEVAPCASFKLARERIAALRNGWRVRYAEMLNPASAPDEERKRKITAETVHTLFAARAAQRSWPKAAAEAGVSERVARQIAACNYPHLPDSARKAWWQTFGRVTPTT